jgi:hypothetical protein
MDFELIPTVVYGREIHMDVFGAPMVFETRLAAETYPGITVPVAGPVLVLHVWDMFDHIPADIDRIAFNEPTFCGKNAKLYFEVKES